MRGRDISDNEICATPIKRVGGFERESESSLGVNVKSVIMFVIVCLAAIVGGKLTGNITPEIYSATSFNEGVKTLF